MLLIRLFLKTSLILSTGKSEREFSSSTMKRKVSFCSDHLSDLIFSKKASKKSNHLRFPKDSKTVVDSLRHSTENNYREVLKFIEKRTQQ